VPEEVRRNIGPRLKCSRIYSRAKVKEMEREALQPASSDPAASHRMPGLGQIPLGIQGVADALNGHSFQIVLHV
jgi:hypothetical protein